MSRNNNINTNIAQIIFPPDMEIRKIRKKKKKPKDSKEKKEAIEDLKETLTEFDNLINEAQSNNIELNEELTSLPKDPSKLNSIKEVKELTADIRNRIQQIQQMIAEQTKPRNMLLDGDVSVPFFRKPQLTPVIPSAVQPMIIPQRPIIPQAKPVIPTPTPTAGRPSQAGKELDELRKEILDKLSPEERAEAEKQIGKIDEPLPKLDDILEREKLLEERKKQGDIREKEFNERLKRLKDLEQMIKEQQAQQKPPAPTKPVIPEKQEDQPDLITQDVKVGEKFIKVKAPKGFFEIEDKFRRYIENVGFDAIKLDEGIYRIPDDKFVELKKEQQDILSEYNRWIGSLNNQEKEFINSDPTMIDFDKQIFDSLNLEPKDIVKQSLEAQGIEVKEITQGTEQPIPEIVGRIKLSESGKKYKTELEQATQRIEDLKTNLENFSEENIPIGEVRTILGMVQSTAVEMDKGYTALATPDRAKIMVEKEEFNVLQTETQALASSIISSSRKDEPDVPFIDDPYELDPTDSKDVKTVKTYIGTPTARLNKKLKDALIELGREVNLEDQFLERYMDLKKKTDKKKTNPTQRNKIIKGIFDDYLQAKQNIKSGVGGVAFLDESKPFEPPKPKTFKIKKKKIKGMKKVEEEPPFSEPQELGVM